MAVTGSTRMQATSIQLLAMLTVLEMALRTVLAQAAPDRGDVPPASAVPGAMRDGVAALHRHLAEPQVLGDLGEIVCAEERVYRGGGRVSYFADRLAIDVLTDTTERSPTFCLPSFRKCDDTRAADSWAFLFTPAATTAQAWTGLLHREPQTIEWTADDLRILLDEDAAHRQAAILSEIGRHDLMRFRIGLDGLPDRPVRAGDGTAVVATSGDVGVLSEGGAFANVLRGARDGGASVSLIGVGTAAALARLAASDAAQVASARVAIEVPDVPFLLDPLVRIAAKLVLNALSTCVMVRMGRVLGNRMIWVVPSNLKLIDRSIRYIRDLAGVSYEQACYTLFDVIEYVEPRRSSGQAYPAPVGVATMRLLHGLDLEGAEARLYDELA
jgi:N-acetylmuramic acid 6-phosphate etherase